MSRPILRQPTRVVATLLGGMIPAFLFLPIFSGCDADYLSHLVFGEIGVLLRIKPLNDALGDATLTETERSRLALVKQVRLFGINTVGLANTDAYTVFDPNGTEPAAYVLSGSAKDSLTPYLWTLPFVGAVPYKGYFDSDRARADAAALRNDGYDVVLGVADGFSTLGILPDPVRQSNLRSDEFDLAELILHEMTHNTIYKTSDADFNEAMATFVGRTAALRYFIALHGEGSPEVLSATERISDKGVIDEFVERLYDDAAAYYEAAAARGDSRDVIVAGREAVFAESLARYQTDYEPRLADPDQWSHLREITLNNAVILGGVRYQGGLSDFADVFELEGGDFPATLQVFSDAAAATDSREFLRQWVADR